MVMRRLRLLMLPLLAVACTTFAQQKTDKDPCTQHPGTCGILVKFNPPFNVNEPLPVPSEVTVDVPLELQPAEVRVETYPLGSQVADLPYEVLAVLSREPNVGKYARFRGIIKECPEQVGGIQVYVLRKKFKQYPLTPWGEAIECREIESKGAR